MAGAACASRRRPGSKMKWQTGGPAAAEMSPPAAIRRRKSIPRRGADASWLASSPSVSQVLREPEDEQTDGPSCGVDENVGDERRARGDESLMKFIRRRIKKDEH